ncbi:Protein kinase, ATP binding site-containing protein [Artemisia annua]|uniref:Protein kinase, ATP binding site-containing protein n=1 Tax=Artemisia annua TaxID=35608 RepID=A0A2U1KPL6_ARTAN|nr:Protein kinase, ATP binding site-containing protein [Artemisia annua]
MGCVSSKQAVSVTPAVDHSGGFKDNGGDVVVEMEVKKKKSKHKRSESGVSGSSELGESGRTSCTTNGGGGGGDSVSFRLGNLHKYVVGEQVAAGWPAWLSAVAGEAIQGWVPLRAEAFEKLEKVGQGTYSSVFRARELETGRIVALKKVRFDNFEPESVRFMAREIVILRRLDHPNVMKLDGIITSRLSCSIYLVFEYMEHDISGLLSCPDINFTESQIKCYMKQLLEGLEHCHSRGVMHRDIKGANLLVNNEGVMKIADFGLANFCNSFSEKKQPLTSRVVTLWYRPPELLLGSTDYEASVDLWSIGCVFAELLLGIPILQGRTEVEQLHKIFKLCGSPPEDYWKKSKLPHATLFKPQHPYESCLWETFKDLPKCAVELIETLLSVEPYKRGTASSALASEYFKMKPYACDPLSLPKYPPNKEIDAKHREDAGRKKQAGRTRGPEISRRLARKQNSSTKLAPQETLPPKSQSQTRQKVNGSSLDTKKGDVILGFELRKPSINTKDDRSHTKHASQEDIPYSGPLQVPSSSGFAWARRRLDDSLSVRSRSRSSSRSLIYEPSGTLHLKTIDSKCNENLDRTNSRGRESNEMNSRGLVIKNWNQLDRPESFDAGSDGFVKRINMIYQDQEEKVEFSGPILSQPNRIDELLARHERQVRQAVRRSWFQRGKKVS